MNNIKAFIIPAIVAIIAFAGGYLLHLKMTNPVLAEELLGGDINRTAAHAAIVNPESDAALLKARMSEFVLLSSWALDYAKLIEDESFTVSVKQLQEAQKKSIEVADNPVEAFKMLQEQNKAITPFILGCDARIASFPEKDFKLASLRDLLLTYSIQNAFLFNDKDQVAQLSDMPDQVVYDDMVYHLQ